jgi:hypothetical protein
MPPSNDDSTIEQLQENPVVGDGVVTLPPRKEKKMPQIDLPDNVASITLKESVDNMQANNRQGRDTFTLASGALQAGIAKTLNELGPVESRAVSGVMATPVAGPATAQAAS